jgi:hypothetical protein
MFKLQCQTNFSSRAHVLYSAMVSGYDNVHIRANLDRMQMAMQYGHSAGDRSSLHRGQRLNVFTGH